MPSRITAKSIAIAALSAALVYAGYSYRDAKADAEIASIHGEYASSARNAERKQRETEQAWRDKLTQLDVKHHKELTNAQAKADAVITGLRADTIRLRKRFTCTVQASAGTAASSVDDAGGEAGLRREDAEFLVRESRRADECAIALTGLQEYVKELTKSPQ